MSKSGKEVQKMREKARIQRTLSLLEIIWQQQPDVRFNQLISNLQHMYSAQNDGYGKRKVVEKWILVMLKQVILTSSISKIRNGKPF